MKEYVYETEVGTMTFQVVGNHLRFAKIEFYCDLALKTDDMKDLENPEIMQGMMRAAVRRILAEKEEDDKQKDG